MKMIRIIKPDNKANAKIKLSLLRRIDVENHPSKAG
jgi:hypothetical protein